MNLIPLTAFLFSAFLLVVSAETSPIITNNKTEYVIPDGALKIMFCETQGDPKPSIRWEINATGNLNFSVSKNASLVIRNHRMSERYGLVNVTCIANNTVGTVRKTFRVVLMKAPMILTKSSNITITGDHSSLFINCETTGYPKPVVEWRFGEHKLNSTDGPYEGKRYRSLRYRFGKIEPITWSTYQVLSNGTIQIENPKYVRHENFSCVAHNTTGQDIRTHFLNFEPREYYWFRAWFSLNSDKDRYTIENIMRIKLNNAFKSLKLFYFVITARYHDRGSVDFTLVWAEKDLQQNGKPRNVAGIANEVNTTLSKDGVNGTLRKLIMFGKPAAPTGLVVDDKKASEISFSWKHPAFFDIRHYNIYKNGVRQKLIVPGFKKTSATLDGLDDDTQYNIEVEPVSRDFDFGERAQLIVKTEVIPSVLTIVLVVVLVSVAIVAVVVVIVYRGLCKRI